MKRQLVVLSLMLGATCAASAQDAVPDNPPVTRNVAAIFSAAPLPGASLSQPAAAAAFSSAPSLAPPAATASALGGPAPDASPSPSPDPKFVYGGRDDFRWQLAIGADWIRFRSSIFNASAVGINTSVTYPEIFDREHVKLLVYGGGPKIAWREKKWEPWVHGIFGGSHEQPQTAGHSRNSYAIEAGGGADYRFNPRLSGRLEADWVRTGFFSQSQNNFQLMGGVVFHF
jgi:hypothetical protein